MEHLRKHFPKSREDFEEMKELIADESCEKADKFIKSRKKINFGVRI